MADWSSFLDEQIVSNGGTMPFFIQKCACQKVWHQVIMKYANRFVNPKILEVGCGRAWDSIYLSYFYHFVSAIDIDKNIVGEANKTNEFLRGNAIIKRGDMFGDLDQYDIIFNNGTYEHFTKEEIKKVIGLHLRRSEYIIFLVPLNMNRDKNRYGNELLMSEREWNRVINEAGGKVLETYGLDFPKALAFATYIPLFSKLFKCFSNYRIFVAEEGARK